MSDDLDKKSDRIPRRTSSLTSPLTSPIRGGGRNNNIGNKGGGGGGGDDLDERQTPTTKRIPAWQLRESMKSQARSSKFQVPSLSSPTKSPTKSPGSNKNRSWKRPSSTFIPRRNLSMPTKLEDEIDPTLPPAFRAAALAERRRKKALGDDFLSMDSVHSNKTQLSTTIRSDPGSDFFDDSDSSFDGEDSFASIGDDGDSDDDEAYREGRNLIARQTIECQRSPTAGGAGAGSNTNKPARVLSDLRLKKIGGTTLDFIAE